MNNTTTKAAETAKKAGTTRNTGVRTMVQIAMLAAVATVLMLWEVPLPFIAPSFYKMDLSEVPIMIGAFAMGPLAAAVIELIKILLNFVLNGTTTAGVGELGNFIMGCALVMPAGFIYKQAKTKKHAIIGMATGIVCMAVASLIYGGITLVNLFQLILNLVITGIFIGSIGIFYSAIMRKTTVAVILSYVTVVLLVLGTVGILFGIGYIQQMQGMYQEDFTGIRLGGLVYLLYFNPAVTLYGLIGQQTTNAYGLVRLCGYFGDYSHSFGVEHMVELSILVQLGCSALLLIAAGRHINPMRK